MRLPSPRCCNAVVTTADNDDGDAEDAKVVVDETSICASLPAVHNVPSKTECG